MKKIYQAPKTDITTIHTHHMLADSLVNKYEEGATGGVLTREKDSKRGGFGGGLWSDMQ